VNSPSTSAYCFLSVFIVNIVLSSSNTQVPRCVTRRESMAQRENKKGSFCTAPLYNTPHFPYLTQNLLYSVFIWSNTTTLGAIDFEYSASDGSCQYALPVKGDCLKGKKKRKTLQLSRYCPKFRNARILKKTEEYQRQVRCRKTVYGMRCLLTWRGWALPEPGLGTLGGLMSGTSGYSSS